MLVEGFVTDFAKRIPPSSHVAVFYNNLNDKWNILSAYIKGTLDRKQSVIYFSNGSQDNTPSKLYEVGIDFDEMRESGRLRVSDGERWYLEEEPLKGSRIFDTWMEAVQNSLSRGFKGLSVICEPTRIFGTDFSAVLSYERSLPRRFSSPLSVVCQYSVEDLLSFEDGGLLLKIADAHGYVITPSFAGAINLSNYYNESLTHSLEGILGKTISSVFFSFVKARRKRYGNSKFGRVEGLDRYLKEFFGNDASKIIKRHILKEQYERIGLKFRSLI